jgi:Flp pilus assembly pilin Flp
MNLIFKGMSNRRGQTMVEYIVIAAMLVLAVSIIAILLFAFRQQSGRVLNLVASEYP